MAFPNDLDKRIQLQRRTLVKDAAGGSAYTWVNYKSKRWAGKMNLSGEEGAVTKHGGSTSVARCVFSIRYDAGVTEAMRVLFRGQVFNIRHVNNFNEQNEKMLLTCDTGAAGA